MLTATVTVPVGTLATVIAASRARAAQPGSATPASASGTRPSPQSFALGTPIILDPAGLLYVYLNAQGVLQAWVQGTDDVGHAAISNLVLDWSPDASRSRRRQAGGRPAS